ncbi:helix-turn-helix transcriptional regulator [Microcoleus sp. herbarium14]|uniref:helix-turn-helix transcriptional regulator n=1 Tax=Microcoleus sp. herbarium14 TaxID=3055439 RepID=UPI002FD08C8D
MSVPLKAIREELDMTQAQFAVALGIDTSTVSRCERGLSEIALTLLQVKRLCRLTGKTLDQLPDYLSQPSSSKLSELPERLGCSVFV